MIEDIGIRIRQLRNDKNISMGQLALEIGSSKSLISQVERGEVYPSLTTLAKMATALDTPIDKFFQMEAETSAKEAEIVVRAGTHKIVYMHDSQTKYHVLTPSLHSDLEFLLIEYPPNNTATDYFSHEGDEYFYVLEGELEMIIAETSYIIRAGDSGCFKSHLRHHFLNHSKATAKLLIAAMKPAL